MTEDCARSVLRLIAVVTIMVGLSMVVVTIIGLIGTSWAMAGIQSSGVQAQMSGAVSQIGLFTVLAYLAVTGLGFGLFAVSRKLAANIVE